MKKKLIAVDISPLHNNNSTRGVGSYTKNLVSSLQNVSTNNSEFKDIEIILIDNPHDTKIEYDLIHYPYFDPFYLTLPSKNSQPTIITIHDLIPRQFKTHYPVGIKGEIKWFLQKQRAKQAKYLITDSHYSKYIISDLLGYPVDKIYVTYLAASKNFRKINDQKLLNEVSSRYNLPKNFVLYNGSIDWHKNIPTLVRSCLKLNYPLVITGAAAITKTSPHPWLQDLRWLQQQTSSLIHLTGYISDEDLPVIYNLATIYCQPSYAEGFGLPVIEAMQCGTPVAFSTEASLPEIMDYNGEFFNPYDQLSLETALTKLWGNPELRQKYSTMGLKHSQAFDWELTAIQTLSVYKMALINGK